MPKIVLEVLEDENGIRRIVPPAEDLEAGLKMFTDDARDFKEILDMEGVDDVSRTEAQRRWFLAVKAEKEQKRLIAAADKLRPLAKREEYPFFIPPYEKYLEVEKDNSDIDKKTGKPETDAQGLMLSLMPLFLGGKDEEKGKKAAGELPPQDYQALYNRMSAAVWPDQGRLRFLSPPASTR